MNETKMFFNGKRGAPFGNQNARKHGFYSRVLKDKQRYDLKQAALVDGLDQEIALLRVKIKSVVEHDTDNLRLISQAVTSLARLIRDRNRIGKKDSRSLQEVVAEVMRDVALPLGVDVNKAMENKDKI